MKYFLMWNNGRENVYALKKWTAARWTVGCKGKVTHAQESIVGVHLPLPDLEPVDGEPLMSVMRGQCDAGPMVTFPAARHHHPLAGTKLYCLVTEARVLSWPGLHSRMGRLEFEPATCWSQVRHPTTTPLSHTVGCSPKKFSVWYLKTWFNFN